MLRCCNDEGVCMRHVDMEAALYSTVQPFSQKPRTPTVAPLLRIGLCDPLQTDL